MRTEFGCALAGVLVILAFMFGVTALLIHHHGAQFVPVWLSCFWWPCAVVNFWDARADSGNKRSERAAAFLRGMGQLVLCASFFVRTWPDGVIMFLIAGPMIFIIPQIVEQIMKRWD
ncbi:MAG: hypothetical protein ABIY70_24480 [Capsulimonas sp.]|uniref:hypothetical protein n=1 Tax=Capsulimonas sp. TaxID=2494211 RepID=UPI003264C4D2